MREFYRQYHEYEYHSHGHWAAFVAVAFMMTLNVLSAIHDVYNPEVAQAQTSTSTLTPSDFSYLGFYNVRPNGEASTYGKALTHRYVNGELRFLTLSHDGKLMEFRPGSSYGSTVTDTTATWQLPSGTVDDFTGIWYEQAKNRLWVTRTLDYGDAGTWYPTRISVMTLGSGSVSNVKTFSLQGVPSKQVFGGAQALPSWAQSELGCVGKPYIVGWGGYTSLVAQTSPASVGPAMFCIPDPDTISNGSTLSSSQFKTLLNAVGNRGYRLTSYTNQVDEEATWRGTNPHGSYYFTWHDSYYNTGMWIEGQTKRGYVAIASLGTGTVRYADGGVQVGGTAFELHIWEPTRLDNGLLTRPDYMSVLNLPRGNTRAWTDYGVGKVTGATYDSVSGRMYVIGFPFANDDFTGRLYVFNVNAGGQVSNPPSTPTTPTQPQPTDAVVSNWSGWSATSSWSSCANGTQTRTEQRTRTIISSATNGGSTPNLTETRTVSQSCTVSQPNPNQDSNSGSGNTPSGYTQCSGEGDVCIFTGTRSVAYGANGTFYYKVLSSGTYCSNSVFGDPLMYTYKYCSYQNQVSQQPEPNPEPQAQAPVVSGVSVSVVQGQATITWNTNVPATSRVEYGLNSSYGSLSTLGSSLTTSHTRVLNNLVPGTYNFRVISAASGNTGRSSNVTFVVRNKPPTILFINVTPGSIILNWPQVSFSGYSGVAILRSTSGFIQTYNLSSQIVTITGNTYTDENVVPGVTYYYSLFVYDDQGNYSDPATVSFVAPEDEPAPSSGSGSSSSGSTGSSGSGSSGSSGSGGGGGGSSSSVVSTPTLPTNFASMTNAQKISVLTQQITQLQVLLAAMSSTQGGVAPAVSGNCTFSRNLHIGLSGEDIRCLQKFLNASGFHVSNSGVGSPGAETNYFGPATMNAVARWQAANGVSPAVGYFGQVSRTKYTQSR